MSDLVHSLRPVFRVIAIVLVVVGAVLASSWLQVLLDVADDGSSLRVWDTTGGPYAEAIAALAWAIPCLLVGLVLLVVTRERQRIISLTRGTDDP
jgi:hypothetical protein